MNDSRLANQADQFAVAAELISKADALLIGAGAGMGVDSGLPDFRGSEGFWKAYPPFHGRSFSQMSTPHWFRTDPALAWGFFGHRLNLYRNAQPHAGFEWLKNWGAQRPLGCFVFTSNVDGQFQRSGFDEGLVIECHGSIHYLQCSRACCDAIWSAESLQLDIDPDTIRCRSEPPLCPHCRDVARPAILMFDDWEWNDARHRMQRRRYMDWLNRVGERRLVTIELGAGLAVPTVRWECERRGTHLIRINPRDPETPAGGVSIPLGALEALSRIRLAK